MKKVNIGTRSEPCVVDAVELARHRIVVTVDGKRLLDADAAHLFLTAKVHGRAKETRVDLLLNKSG